MFHGFTRIQRLTIVYDCAMSWIRMRSAFLIIVLLPAAEARAQHDQATPVIRVGAHAVGVATHVTPAAVGRDLTEAYVTQPMLMGHASFLRAALSLQGVINLEGWTLERGELNAGIWGEGYVDRRHPHTYLHEAIASLRHSFGRVGVSLSGGKGFAPFGTDDPMVRPFVKYPANHHLSQILERVVAIGAIRYGPGILEAGVFNGDEPFGPTSNGRLERFADSWSVRGTLLPGSDLELQASLAHAESPEILLGGGLNHRKLSASVRFERSLGATDVYAHGEYARTAYVNESVERFAFESFLVEGSAMRGGWQAALRYEHTVRPEEERTDEAFPFRSIRTPTDFSILGRTRWNIVTAHVARGLRLGPGSIEPFVEVERSHAETVNRPAVYEPDQIFGDNVLWTMSFGVRMSAGFIHHRMGRYGVALAESNTQTRH